MRQMPIGKAASVDTSTIQPSPAKEVSATTGKAGALPARLAALPMNGAFVKGGSEDTWEGRN